MIDEYLRQLEKHLRAHAMPFGVRRVLAECRAHLEESAEAVGPEQAVKNFGPVKDVAESFRVSLGQRHARAAAWLLPLCNAVLFAAAPTSSAGRSIALIGLLASLPALLASPLLRRLGKPAQVVFGLSMFFACCMPTAAAAIGGLHALGAIAAPLALFAGICGSVFLVMPRPRGFGAGLPRAAP